MKYSVLAILDQIPTYGLAVRNELMRRQERRRQINVGQIYRTIERLVRDGLACHVDTTSDGLPLYAATDGGRDLVRQWTVTPQSDPMKPWEAMVGHVLLVRTLPGYPVRPLINAYNRVWSQLLASVHESDQSLGAQAERELANAALAWLDVANRAGDSPIPISTERPPRGRPAG